MEDQQQDPPEVIQLQEECNNFETLLDGYNKWLTSKTCFLQELEMENRTLRAFLKAKEETFSAIMTNYEKCKTVIEGYKQNEDILDKHMDEVNCMSEQIQDKYESLKKHCIAEIDRANAEITNMHSDYEKKIQMQVSLLKALEVKYDCLSDTVNDRTEQCHSMEALITEVTDKM